MIVVSTMLSPGPMIFQPPLCVRPYSRPRHLPLITTATCRLPSTACTQTMAPCSSLIANVRVEPRKAIGKTMRAVVAE